MRFKNLVSAGLLSAAALVAAPANAVFINGLISGSDGFVANSLGVSSFVVSGLGVGGVPTAGANGVLLLLPAPGVGCTGDLCANGPISGAGRYDLPGGVQSSITLSNGLTFTPTGAPFSLVRTLLACSAGLCGDALDFRLNGTWTGAGFDATDGLFVLSAQGTCIQSGAGCNGQSSATWSASLAATGRPTTVPEPGSMALLGLGLGLAGWLSRRRKH